MCPRERLARLQEGYAELREENGRMEEEAKKQEVTERSTERARSVRPPDP